MAEQTLADAASPQTALQTETAALPLFRPSKKRRAIRQQHALASPAVAPPPASPAAENGTSLDKGCDRNGTYKGDDNDDDDDQDDQDDDDDSDDDDDDDEPKSQAPVSDLVRRRLARRPRLRGVEFRAPGTRDVGERGMVLHGAEDGTGELTLPALGIPQRFQKSTGVIEELNDRHMMEYIESKLAGADSPNLHARMTSPYADASPDRSRDLATLPGHGADGQPAAFRGRILEVDLGTESRERNVTLTELARRRLAGIDKPAGDEQPDRDGRPRPRCNRRDSEDEKRDRMVEEVLHENRLEVYDIPTAFGLPPNRPLDPNVAADDRVVDYFRREFMEELARRHQLRRRKRRAAVNAPPSSSKAGGGGGGPGGPSRPGKKEDGKILRGPKLGGSRNVRSQMRDRLLREMEDKEKARKTAGYGAPLGGQPGLRK